jgi:hypothetical protein
VASRGFAVFYEDNGFRDMFIYGSIAMLAALALPAKRAHAAEMYLCGDGRILEVTNSNRGAAARADTCVSTWQNERQKAVMTKAGKANDSALAPMQTTAYQIQTSGIDSVVNATELPEVDAKPTPVRERLAMSREAMRATPRTKLGTKDGRRKHAAHSHASRDPGFKGLRHMGDGIFAE